MHKKTELLYIVKGMQCSNSIMKVDSEILKGSTN